MIFRDRIVFRVEAFDSAVGNTDGAGIQNVKFDITGPNGEVHSRPENTAGYCAFGGGEPNCDVWVFSQRGNKWPNGKTIEDGTHSVTITITPKQGKPVQWFWTIRDQEVEVAVRLLPRASPWGDASAIVVRLRRRRRPREA